MGRQTDSECMDRQTDGWMNGQTDRWMYGQTEGWTNRGRQTDGQQLMGCAKIYKTKI